MGSRWTIAALLVLVLACGAPARAQWTQFRQNPEHNPSVPGRLHATWRIETGGPFSASPTVVGNTLYIGNNAGTLFAIDIRDGRTLWTYRAKAPLMSNPLVWNGLVIVGEGDQMPYPGDKSHAIFVGQGHNALIAVDAKTGEERWNVSIGGSGMPTPAIVGEVLVHHNGSGRLLALDPATGAKGYEVDLESVASMSAILPIDRERIVTTGVAMNTIFGLNARDGSTAWQDALPAKASGIGDCPPASDGRYAFCNYVMPPDGAEKVLTNRPAVQHAYAIDLSDGAMVWDVPYANGTLPTWNEAAIPLLVNRTVYVGSSLAPQVSALDASDGHELWRTQVRGPVKGSIAEHRGVLYFGDLAGFLWALDARTGRVVGTKNMGTPFNVGSPIVAGRTLIIGSNTGALLAIPLWNIRHARDR